MCNKCIRLGVCVYIFISTQNVLPLSIFLYRIVQVIMVLLLLQVNGFFGARGVMGNIPDAYTYIASSFYHMVGYYNMQHRIRLYEYYRDQWTYHVKGLWFYLPHQTVPFLSMMGSSNFGKHFYASRIKDSGHIVFWPVRLSVTLVMSFTP